MEAFISVLIAEYIPGTNLPFIVFNIQLFGSIAAELLERHHRSFTSFIFCIYSSQIRKKGACI